MPELALRAATPHGQARADTIAAFLAAAGWGTARRQPLAGDASFRRYERLTGPRGTAVLMDEPVPEVAQRFVSIATLLHGLGYSAPAILAGEAEAGLLLLEDLGDDTYTRLLARGEDESALYALAVDLLLDLQRRATPDLLQRVPVWDEARALGEVERLLDWYWPAALGRPAPEAARHGFAEAWRAVLPSRHAAPETLALFDFHVDNLMRLPGRAGVAACGLLDFQDAVRAPLPFDLVSLLQDVRRDVPAAIVETMRARYLAGSPGVDRAGFELSYAVIGAQRNTRIAGTFARLFLRDGKPGYLPHLPRVWRLLEQDLRHPALAPVRSWFDAHLPPEARRAPLLPR